MPDGLLEDFSADHKIILEKLRDLEAALLEPQVEKMLGIVRFIEREIVVHFRKEEEVLFPLLDEKFRKGIESIGVGVRPAGGPIKVMLAEHKSIIYVIKEINATSVQPDLAGLANRCRHLIDLKRGHIFREDQVLFKVAEAVLTPEEKHMAALKLGELQPKPRGTP